MVPFEYRTIRITNFETFGIQMDSEFERSEFEPPLYGWVIMSSQTIFYQKYAYTLQTQKICQDMHNMFWVLHSNIPKWEFFATALVVSFVNIENPLIAAYVHPD